MATKPYYYRGATHDARDIERQKPEPAAPFDPAALVPQYARGNSALTPQYARDAAPPRTDVSKHRRGLDKPLSQDAVDALMATDAPATTASAGARRRLAPGRQERDASAAGARLSGNTRASERERQAMRKEIDSALFRLRATGGGLNMRSKRQLFGALLGRKADLTSEAYRTQNQRSMEGARLANETAQSNAALAERGADRRARTNQFYDELNEDSRIRDEDLSIRRSSAASQDNYLDAMIKDAEAQRDSDRYGLTRRGIRNKDDYERIDKLTAELLDANPDLGAEEARRRATQSLVIDADTVNRPLDSDPLVAGANDYMEGVARRLSAERPLTQKLFDPGSSVFEAAPLVQAGTYPFEQLEVTQTPFLQRAADMFLPGDQIKPYYLTGPEVEGLRVRQPFDDKRGAQEVLEQARRAARLRRKTRKPQE